MGVLCSSLLSRQVDESVFVAENSLQVHDGITIDTVALQARRCPNPAACPKQTWSLRVASGNASGSGRDTCLFELDQLVGAMSTINSTRRPGSMCAEGYSNSRAGCAGCAESYGRSIMDPFKCEPCGKSILQWAGWFLQPSLLFMLSLRSAQSAAGRGQSAAFANDALKILISYSSGAAVVASPLSSLKVVSDRSKQTANLRKAVWSQWMLELGLKTASVADTTAPWYSSSHDCLMEPFNQGQPASLKQLLLLALALPTTVLALSVLMLIIESLFSRVSVADRLLTCTIVAGNQFLPGVVAACARAIPCYHTQQGGPNTVWHSLMAYEPAECNERNWYAIINGPVMAMAFLAGPVYLFVLVRCWTREDRLLAFLTGSYRKEMKVWESLRLAKTMLLVGVGAAVPATYAPALQLALALIILTVFLAAHLHMRPYQKDRWKLAVAEAVSLLALVISFTLCGLLANGAWWLTPDMEGALLFSTGALLTMTFMGLLALFAIARWQAMFEPEAIEQ